MGEQLGGKTMVMALLSHDDPNVRYEALLAVQKLMVHNWEYLGKQLEKPGAQTGVSGQFLKDEGQVEEEEDEKAEEEKEEDEGQVQVEAWQPWTLKCLLEYVFMFLKCGCPYV